MHGNPLLTNLHQLRETHGHTQALTLRCAPLCSFRLHQSPKHKYAYPNFGAPNSDGHVSLALECILRQTGRLYIAYLLLRHQHLQIRDFAAHQYDRESYWHPSGTLVYLDVDLKRVCK
jgi:hypothetical protein